PAAEVSFNRFGRLTAAGPAVFTHGNRGKGWMVLGDRGEWNEWGEIVLRGRVRPMIKVGARRLDPAEIERALLQIDGVREAWVTEWNAGGEARPAAVVSSDRTAGEIRSLLRAHLPAWK